jgi:hypothetical protein
VIWFLLLTPRFYRALARDLGNTVLGPRCHVTGEHVYPRDRANHESVNHPGEGTCA